MATPIATSNIITQAFRLMEVSPPSSLADNSEKAKAANEQYPIALRMCLEQEDFSFARRFVVLSRANTPEGLMADPELPFFYTLPPDLLKLRKVVDNYARWRIDGDYVVADVNADAGLQIRYTRKIENETRLPATFQTAVSYQLAIFLAPKFVGSRTKRSDLQVDGANALRLAIKNDAVSASAARWDGLEDQGDWVCEAIR